MEQDEEIQDYLDLSREFLTSARRDVEGGLHAPARLNMLQSLELGLKAALMAKTRTTGADWGTHNIHGPFGKHFRDALSQSLLARVNRLIQEYGKSRYPDWESPSPEALESDLAFIETFVKETLPQLVAEARS